LPSASCIRSTRTSIPKVGTIFFSIVLFDKEFPLKLKLKSKVNLKFILKFNVQSSTKTAWLESASEIYRPTERPPLVGEVSANFSESSTITFKMLSLVALFFLSLSRDRGWPVLCYFWSSE
jgi:hypothetical protein